MVPTKIHTICPNTNQDTNAPHSSAFHGRMLRMENHLKRTFSRWPKPLAAARSSSFVGRWGIFGRCRYLDMESARDACSDPSGVGVFAGACCGPSGSCLGADALFLSPSPLVWELLALFPDTAEFPRPFLACRLCSHTCRAKWLRFARCPELPTSAESAAAVHVVTTALVEDGLELSPRSSRPPEVQLFRTFLGETRDGQGWKNRRAVWNNRVFGVCGVLKNCPGDRLFDRGRGPGSLAARTVTESRIEPQNWRPSCVVVALEVIVERHAGTHGPQKAKFQAIVDGGCRYASRSGVVLGPGWSGRV